MQVNSFQHKNLTYTCRCLWICVFSQPNFILCVCVCVCVCSCVRARALHSCKILK